MKIIKIDNYTQINMTADEYIEIVNNTTEHQNIMDANVIEIIESAN